MMLPLPDMSSLPFLAALTTDCGFKVFASDNLGVILDKLWDDEIKWIFIADFLIFVVFCICWTLLVTTVSLPPDTRSTSELRRGTFMKLTCFSFLSPYSARRPMPQTFKGGL